MNQFPFLVRREFWEHRNTFVVLPAVMTAFLLAMMLLVFVAATSDFIAMDIQMDHEDDSQHESMHSDDAFALVAQKLGLLDESQRQHYLSAGLKGFAVPFMLVLSLVVFFYLSDSLYADRRDRSILFWKSLPVSDVMTVITKLFVGVVAVPGVYFLGLVLLQLVGLILLSMSALGTETEVWSGIWAPANLPGEWLGYMLVLAFYILWCLPMFGLVMLVSAWVKSVPFAWILGVPIVIIIIEKLFTNQDRISVWLSRHIFAIKADEQPLGEFVSENFVSLEMLSAILMGAVLIGLAIWRRSKADEI